MTIVKDMREFINRSDNIEITRLLPVDNDIPTNIFILEVKGAVEFIAFSSHVVELQKSPPLMLIILRQHLIERFMNDHIADNIDDGIVIHFFHIPCIICIETV